MTDFTHGIQSARCGEDSAAKMIAFFPVGMMFAGVRIQMFPVRMQSAHWCDDKNLPWGCTSLTVMM